MLLLFTGRSPRLQWHDQHPVQIGHTRRQRVQTDNHNIQVTGEKLDLKTRTFEGLVVLAHGVLHRRLVLEGHVGKIVSTNLQECNSATILEVIVQILLGDFVGNIPHDNGLLGLVVMRLIGPQHKQPLPAVVLLVPQHNAVPVGFVRNPQEGRNRPLGALLFPQKVHTLDRGKLLQVSLQVLLAAGRGNVLHVDQQLSIQLHLFLGALSVGNMADC